MKDAARSRVPAPDPTRRAQANTLTEVNLDDFLESLGLAGMWPGRRLVRWLFRVPARRFAYTIMRFDDLVGEQGLRAAGAWLVRRYVRRLETAGRENVPAAGPALVLSNHPGLTDTVALFATLPRPDLRVLALTRPFLNALPHTSRQLLYLSTDEAERLPAVRAAVRCLREGKALLTFPAGEIEPDPGAHGVPDAAASLQRWATSIALFARRVPQTRIVPVIVSGVVSLRALRNPLTRLRRTRKGRDHMAAMLQVLLPASFNVSVRVAYGPSLACDELLAAKADITRTVTECARRLIESPPAEWETVFAADARPGTTLD